MFFPLIFIFINLSWFNSRGAFYRPGLPGWSAATVGDLPYGSRSHSAAHFLLLQSPWTVAVCQWAKGNNQPCAPRKLSPACSVWAVWTHWQIWPEAIFDAISRNKMFTLMWWKELLQLCQKQLSRFFSGWQRRNSTKKLTKRKEKLSKTELIKRYFLSVCVCVCVRVSWRQLIFYYMKPISYSTSRLCQWWACYPKQVK